uniref:Uncharacterized protein n=1 Tax=Vespula pensylvanica TaxID=30213 RepID=A0A834P747_VESPE|nr:hypothetical protein H0235_004230 [Vespula pensylvanica]
MSSYSSDSERNEGKINLKETWKRLSDSFVPLTSPSLEKDLPRFLGNYENISGNRQSELHDINQSSSRWLRYITSGNLLIKISQYPYCAVAGLTVGIGGAMLWMLD